MNATEYFKKEHEEGPEHFFGCFHGDDMVQFAEAYHKLKSTELINTINKQCKTYFIQTEEHIKDSAWLKQDVIETIWNSTGK